MAPRNVSVFAFALFALTGCAAQQATDVDLAPAPRTDAAAQAPQAEAAPPVVVVPVAVPEAAAPVVVVDAGAAGGDAAVDVARSEASAPDGAARSDAVADARPEASSPDGGTVPDATPDARDAGAVVDGRADGSDGRRTINEILAATFPEPCAPESTRMCGGISRDGDHVVETIAMACYRGVWVANSYECSEGCRVAGRMCAP